MKSKILLLALLFTQASFLFSQSLPFDFEVATPIGNFGGSTGTLVNTAPGSGANTVLQVVKAAGSEVWAGVSISLSSGLSADPISATFTMRVWSSTAIPVLFKIEHPNATLNREVSQNYTTPNAWQTLSYTFTNLAAGYNLIAMFPNFGSTVGGTHYVDDVQVTFASAPATGTDLQIVKSVSNPTPSIGETIVFTLDVSNNGPDAATGVSVSDLLPSGYTYVSDDGSGAYIPGTGIWTIGNLANGATDQLNITVTVNAAGVYANTATITGIETDNNAGNNTSTITPVLTTVIALPITFEEIPAEVVFTDFDNGVGTIEDNPSIDLNNPSAKVGKIVRNGASIYSGSKIQLTSKLDFTTNPIITMKVYSTAVGIPVLLKLEGGLPDQVLAITTKVNEWEVLSFDFSGAASNENDELVFMFNFEVAPSGDTYYFDDVEYNIVDLGPDLAPGNCLQFDGTGDYVDCTNNTAFDFATGDFTLQSWVKTLATDKTILGKKGLPAPDNCGTGCTITGCTAAYDGTFATNGYSYSFVTTGSGPLYNVELTFVMNDPQIGIHAYFWQNYTPGQVNPDFVIDYGINSPGPFTTTLTDLSIGDVIIFRFKWDWDSGGLGITQEFSYTVGDTDCDQAPVGVAGEYSIGVTGGKADFNIGGSSVVGTTAINDGNWHNITGVRSGSDTYIYVDGISEGSAVSNANYASPIGPLLIGSLDGTDSFTGQIDEVRIWNSAKTQEEIIADMNQTIDITTVSDDLVGYYRLDEVIGTRTADRIGLNWAYFNDDPTWTNSSAFNVWTGLTNGNWATVGNWSDVDGGPGAGANVHIGILNPPSTAGDLTLGNVVVEEGASFTVSATNLLTANNNLFPMGTMNVAGSAGADPGKVTVEGDLFVGSAGNLNLLTPSNDNPSGSLITKGNIYGTGDVNIDRYFTVDNSWQQVAVPLANQSTALFTENTPSGNYNANFLSYDETYDFTPDPGDATYANWLVDYGYWTAAQPGGVGVGLNMIVGESYFYYNEGDVVVNLSSVATDLTTGDKDIALLYTSNDNGSLVGNYYDGWNFIGNPYPSAIDWSTFGPQAGVDATSYFWNGTTENYDYYGGTPLWGTGQTNNGVVISQEIPAMQGFWVHLSAATVGDKITLTNLNQVHSSQAIHKDNPEADFDFIRLQADFKGLSDRTLIGYFNDATVNFDSQYDAYKRFPNNDIPMLYSLTSDPQFPLALNALPKSSVGQIVKLGYQSSHSGTHTISLVNQNLNVPIILRDLYFDSETDLTQSAYSFEFDAGDSRNRFELVIINNTLGNAELNLEDRILYPNPVSKMVNLNVGNITEIKIYTVQGKEVFRKEISNNKFDVSFLLNGMYIIIASDKSGNKYRDKFIKM